MNAGDKITIPGALDKGGSLERLCAFVEDMLDTLQIKDGQDRKMGRWLAGQGRLELAMARGHFIQALPRDPAKPSLAPTYPLPHKSSTSYVQELDDWLDKQAAERDPHYRIRVQWGSFLWLESEHP